MRFAAHSARASGDALRRLTRASEDVLRPSVLAALMGLVTAGGCVEKIVDSPAPPLGDGDGEADGNNGGGMDAGNNDGPDAGPGGSGSGGKDAGNDAQLSCISYCSANLRVCTDTWSQFMDMQGCVNMCEDWARGSESDRSVDTLGCRMWATNRAEDTGEVDRYCDQSGPSGGGVCGERCDVFCKGVTTLCTEDNVPVQGFEEPYASEDVCLAQCNGNFKVDTDDELPGSGDTINCRIFHLSLAYKAKGESADQVATHCGHTRADPRDSQVCRDPADAGVP